VLISDLFDRSGFQRGLDLLRHHRHEPSLVHVFDQSERTPELRGDIQLRDLETAEGRKLTISPRSLQRYRRVFERFLESVRSYSRAYGLACAQTSTATPFDTLILQMMREAGVVK
jgi:hypothetical protein